MNKSGVKYGNFEPHERQRNFTVFFYYNKDHADYFEALLLEHAIPFERGQGKDLIKRHLFGVHQKYIEKAKELNDEVGNYYRKPFLGDKGFRNFVLIFTLTAIILALVGYFLKP